MLSFTHVPSRALRSAEVKADTAMLVGLIFQLVVTFLDAEHQRQVVHAKQQIKTEDGDTKMADEEVMEQNERQQCLDTYALLDEEMEQCVPEVKKKWVEFKREAEFDLSEEDADAADRYARSLLQRLDHVIVNFMSKFE